MPLKSGHVLRAWDDWRLGIRYRSFGTKSTPSHVLYIVESQIESMSLNYRAPWDKTMALPATLTVGLH
jgi:hypothetical protein